MKKLILSAAIGLTLLPALSTPAVAQTREQQRRWDNAQQRYDRETQLYERERDIYDRARGWNNRDRYNDSRNDRDWDRYRTDYDAARYYRDGSRYQERRLGSNDEVYRGSDGRYYCKRSDGTTGLIVGGAAGGILGNVIDGGRSRTAGTLIGGALGALLGRSVEQSQDEIRCR